MRVVGSIEARMGSSRLPGKTLTEIWSGKHLLECVVNRFRCCKSIDDVVVATTSESNDDSIAEWCESAGVSYFRGSEHDVLDRVVGAALHHHADAIVQMGADSAYLDWELIDQLVERYRDGAFDYVCNDLRLTYPLGIYGHVVGVKTLADLNARTDLNEDDRSDVVRKIFENPSDFRILNLEASEGLRLPQLRLTIDYPEDLAQARDLYAYFGGVEFTTRQIVDLYKHQPQRFEQTRGLVQQAAPFLFSGK